MSTDDKSTNDSTQDGNNTGDSTSDADEKFTPITSQADLDKALKGRLERERSKFADYADLKAKAAKFDEIEEANKSELEKAADALKAAEAERDKAVTKALRMQIAADHEISSEDAELFLTGTDEETLLAQAERLAAREVNRKTTGSRLPAEGRLPADPKPSTADQFAEWASGQFTH